MYTQPVQRHFTTAVYIFDAEGRVLLLWHGKFQKWMPPGGHIDENEVAEEAAIRECKEETGLDVEILGGSDVDFFGLTLNEGRMMKLPFAMTLENIPAFAGSATKPPQLAHQHMDFHFKARLTDPSQPIIQEHPDAVVRWFTKEEVAGLLDDEIFANVRSFIVSVRSSPFGSAQDDSATTRNGFGVMVSGAEP